MEGLLLLIRRFLSPRYILIPFFLFLFGIAAVQAKTVVIGGGSGFLSVPDMSGLTPGDVLAITPGQYSGGIFSNLKGITITNNNGTVTFTDQVTLNTLVECVFSGFQFKNVPNISIRWDGNSRRCVEKNIYFQNCAGSVNDASDHNIYNGDTSSLKFYMVTFDSLTLYQSGMVMLGGWGEAKDKACYMDSVVFSRIKIDSTTTNGSEVRGIIFRIDAHDWRVTYKGTNTGSGDIGIFFIDGYGAIHDIYRFGGRGYILRIWNVGLKVPGNMYFYNNIDLNSTQYGTLDTRVDPVEFTEFTTGGNCYIFNNTAGNLEEHIGYWSSLAVVGTFASPWICQTRNNLGFNLSTNGKPPITMNQSSDTWISDSANNLYFTNADGVIDPVTGVPVTNSPVIGKGLTLPIVTDDIYHNPRIGAYDIGAVQHGGAIITAPANQPPVVITGSAQTIFMPASNTTIDGSKSYDPDGSIVSYAWVLVSGTGGSIASPAASVSKVSGLTAGTYVYKLTATDNGDSSASALDTIIVMPAGNLPPIANAGADQTITLPVDSTTIDGSASRDQDNGGLISSFTWVQSAGPSKALMGDSTKASTSVSGLQSGIYVFKLTVTDSSGAKATDSLTITVKDSLSNPPVVNKPPVANAGSSITIILPDDSATLNGSKSTDPDGTIISYRWTKISGPNTPGSAGDTSYVIFLTGLVAGQYNYQLTVTDNDSSSSNANVKITVVAPPNISPIANAGPDQTITAPSDSVILDGNASYDPDGMIKTFNWTKITGQGAIVISNGNSATPLISGLTAGVYVFQLTVTDNSGATNTDQVLITVDPEPTIPNQSPVANAGNNATITLPVSSITLDGTSSFDPDGTITYYGWSMVSGPSNPAIANINEAKTTASGLVAGTYIFQLTVTDNSGSSDFDQITITVLPGQPAANETPVVVISADTTMYLPSNSYVLNASRSYDPDGSITGYQWQEISGPSTPMATSMNDPQVDVSNLQAGTYEFKVTVTDNTGGKSDATIKISVDNPPSSNDQLIVFPNPAHDVINSKISSSVNGTISQIIYDMSGRSVLTDQSEKSIDVFERTLNISSLAKGTYILQVNIDNRKTMVTKFVKQ